jgi:D-alanyl-D-alanine carboxypeptidase (penicillin-binding protein 5/6)
MNEKANEIGCTNSHFKNPSGIHDDDHYSTAYDLSLIAKYCMENKTFRSIVSSKSCTIGATNKSDSRHYVNTNDLLNSSSKYYLDGCIGIKTGYTKEAKNCLISACTRDNLELICVVLGAQTTENGDSARYVDSHTIFDYGYNNYSIKTIMEKDTVVTNIKISNGTKETKDLDLLLSDDIAVLTKNDEELIEPTITLNESKNAPISKGSTIGTITYNVNGIEYTSNLIASHDVEQSDFFIIILKIALGLIIFLILITILFSKSKKKKKRKSKYSRHY